MNSRRPIRAQAHRRQTRPIRASAIVLGGAVIVAAVGALWWASGPGQATERARPPSPAVQTTGPVAARSVAPGDPPRSIGVGTDTAPSTSSATAGLPRASPAAVAGTVGDGGFGLGLLIADRGNGRLLIVDRTGRTLWRFPGPGSLPTGQAFAADDAFLAPDGRTIVANDEAHQVIDRIDVVSRRIVWQYGHYGRSGSAPGYLHTPDDAYPLANGDITVADIRNCRILEIDRARRIVRQWGRTGVCRHRPPFSYADPNGDTPLPDGGLLITEIRGSHVVRVDSRGRVVFDVHVPTAYPSDAQLDPNGNVLVVDYSDPGAVLRVSPHGQVLWRYRPTSGRGRLNHPSLAILLPDGTIAVNDDFRARVIVIDPRTKRIVWQYGHTGVRGRGPGYLSIPDGMDLIPMGTRL